MSGKRIEIIDIEPHSITTYPSLTAYAKTVGISAARISNYLKGQSSISTQQHQRILAMAYEVPQIGAREKNTHSKKSKAPS